VYRHRTCAPRPDKHAEGLVATTLSPGRPRDRGHRRHIDRGSLAGRGAEDDEIEREDERELLD
jgi:hypothetical protein